MDGGREVRIEQEMGDCANQRGVSRERCLNRRCELAGRVCIPELLRGRGRVPLARWVACGRGNDPDAVVLQVPEGELGMVRLAGRAELGEQVAKWRFDG